MKKRKGSSLIISVMTFSLISIICITLLALTLTNNNIVSDDEKYMDNFYKCDGGIEIVKGAIIHNIGDYFQGNNKKEFIANIESINVDNLNIDIINDDIKEEKQTLVFDVSIYRQVHETTKEIKVLFSVDLTKVTDDKEFIKISDYRETK